MKQGSQQAQEGGSGNFGSVMNRKQVLQYSTNQQPANTKNPIQPTSTDGVSKDLSAGANPANVQSADHTFKQPSSAYGVASATGVPQHQGHTSSTMIPQSAPTSAALTVIAPAQNNFQHPSQYSSVILNSTSSVSHAAGNQIGRAHV